MIFWLEQEDKNINIAYAKSFYVMRILFTQTPFPIFITPFSNKCCLHIILLENVDENILFSTTTTESDNKGLKLALCLTKQDVILQIGTCWLTEKTRETNIRHIDWSFDVANIFAQLLVYFWTMLFYKKSVTINSSSDKGQKLSNILGSLFFPSKQIEESNIHQSSQEAVSSIHYILFRRSGCHPLPTVEIV